MNNKHARRVLLILMIYFVIAISIFWILTRYFSISDVASVGQLCFEILLFPTVIIGFWITIEEFRKSQVLPKLSLFWKGDRTIDLEDDCLVLETSIHDVKTFYLRLYVKNDSASMTTWYRLSFDIPRQLAQPLSDSYEVRWHKGDVKDWNTSGNSEKTTHEFKSNGQYALYPGEEIHIATLELKIFPKLVYPNRIYIPHSVVTDKTRLQYGVCKIKVRLENFASKIPLE